MLKKIKSIFLAVGPVSLVFIFSLIAIIYAWTQPIQNPPAGNVPPPLNVGPQGQAKQGGLILNTGGADTGLIVYSGRVGIGTTSPTQKLDVTGGYIRSDTGFCIQNSCITSWPAGTGGISGSGTTNYLSKFTGSTSIGNSIIYDNSTNVGIGTTNPTQKLDVAGYVKGTGLCIGSDCRTTWPASYSAKSCESGYAIQSFDVNSNALSCVKLPSSVVCTYNNKTYSIGAECRLYCSPMWPGSSHYYDTRLKCKSDGSWETLTYTNGCPAMPHCGQ